MSNTMIPTMIFRWVERETCDGPDADGDDRWTTERVLQQRFSSLGGQSEWRDVPLVTRDVKGNLHE